VSLSRRTFLEAAALAPAAELKAELPTRVLGRTGARVSILAYGCGSSWSEYGTFDQALATLTQALDLGITYIDTAASYGKGESEKIVGSLMKSRRGNVWLATKIRERNYDQVLSAVDASLARLQTDHVDLLHIHDLQGMDDLAAIEGPNGALKAFYKIRDEKQARFIGITSHKDPAALKAALLRHDFDCTQMSLNPALRGSEGESCFESLALPVAVEKKLGIIAMKVFAQARYKAPPAQLMRYALTLPVAAATIGMPVPKVLKEDVLLARDFRPLPDDEMKRLASTLRVAHGADLDRFFRCHVDV
jgi:uncharacterized protein